MTTRFTALGVALVLLAGCGKKPGGATATSATSPTDIGPVLEQLTWSVRQYSLANHSVPGSLNVVIAAGYLTNLPPAPVGKKFAIDPKNLQVVLVNQ
jgi:hypothetical protein